MKVQLKPGEPVKFNGKRVVATEALPVVLSGEAADLEPLVDAGIAAEVDDKTATAILAAAKKAATQPQK